ncbi:MAG: linear amide C-N hydrolase [Legionellaceae bacterium]|nr:linear amide C-N hydrolase [Legionellaceae bacterium]
MCTRVLYSGDQNLVITGRNMDWKEDMGTNLYLFPAKIHRDGRAGAHSMTWDSRFGSIVCAGYESGSTDGMNEKGLVANLLYLVESDYGAALPDRPNLSISLWLQYVLDNFATVKEAVDALRRVPFNIVPMQLPNGESATLHLAISDASGDSAIFEYVEGQLSIHHGKAYTVMTNSPPYAQQIALNEYWKNIGGLSFLPGTNRAADRFVRASFLLDAIPKKMSPQYIQGVPTQSFRYQAVAQVLSIMRSVSVPLGISTPDEPNISSTLWRTIADQSHLVYYFDSATRPNTFWIDFNNIDFNATAPIKKLILQNGEIYAGEVSAEFSNSTAFPFLAATPG